MDATPQPNSEDIGGILQRIQRLGSATESFFSRIYRGLNRRSELERSQQIARKLYRQREYWRVEAEKNEQKLLRLGGIVSTLTDGIVLQDTEGRIVLMNQAARDLIGSKKALRDSELSGLFDAYKDIKRVNAELVPLGEPQRISMNNRVIGATVAAVADPQGERIGTLFVLRDVTEETLGDRLKDQFVTAISHELRTPMNALKMSSEVLLGTPDGKPANRRMLEMIGRNVDVLDRMIVELLDISEMTAGNFQVRQHPVELEALIWTVVNGAMPEIRKGSLDVSVMARDTGQLEIIGDEERIRWALGHLLQNSIRYTEKAGHIFVIISKQRNANEVAIQVVDTGVGISEKDLPHIFERFYRGEPRTAEGKLLDPRGLGQGLYVARTVSEAHGGYLSVQSTPGKGTVFTMVLPTKVA